MANNESLIKRYFSLALWLGLFQLISFGMSFITRANLSDWYVNLNKSILTPPGFVFGIVWTILYVFLALIGWMLFTDNNYKQLKYLKRYYGIQMLLNWAWTPLFFHFHYTHSAFIVLIIMIFLVARLIFLSFQANFKIAGYLLLPYWIWICFASYLNGWIVFLN